MFSRVTSFRCCLLIASIWCAFTQELTPDDLPPGMQLVIRDLDRIATEAARNPTDIGYTLGVVNQDRLAWTKSYGYAAATRQQLATADTVYGIGSAAFTAIMLLQLTRAGTVHLSDPVERYLPEMKSVHNPYPGAAPVTLLQLAIHTSGLALDSRDAATYTSGSAAQWENTLIAALPHTSYEFELGTHAASSNIDESILALALSRAAHQPYSDYLKHRILLPMGMTHTEFLVSGAETSGLGFRPAVYTTIGDLARFASFMMLHGPEAVLPRRDLEANYRRLWVTNSIAIPNPNEGYGIGFHGETWTSNHYYFIPPVAFPGAAYEAALWFEPRRHAAMILLHHGSSGTALGQMIHSYVYTLNAQKNDAGRQEPVRPFPYTEEEVSFENKAAEIRLAGTLTIPQGKGPFLAVILIPKSGPLDRDERLFNHRPFFILADYLTRAGIAVLRADVRGVGKSGGKFGPAPMDDSAADAEAALAYLKTRPEVNPRGIGLLSHGEGGLAASIVAARNRDVAFLAMLSAPAVRAAENSVESSRLNAVANGELDRKADDQAGQSRKIFSIIQEERDPASLDRKLRDVLAGKLPEAQLAGQIRQWSSPAFRRTITYDPAPALSKLACPVLALYAEKDLSVPANLNVPAMRAAREASGNKNFTVEELPDLNLLFQTADVGIGREANWTEETISPVVLGKLANWLSQLPVR
uniref:Beta-lactamase n=1 Tax=Solibacter usitatus (strain Ellin6076) TaxID=234267 RepID=Q01RP8_SOLUE